MEIKNASISRASFNNMLAKTPDEKFCDKN